MIRELQSQHKDWMHNNFGTHDQDNAGDLRNLLGITEELGELSHAVLKSKQGIRMNEDHEANKKDAVADIFIYLMGFCNDHKIDLEFEILQVWDKVKERRKENWPETKPSLSSGAAMLLEEEE